MIDLYTWPIPDGHKIHIMLEECRLPYAVHAVDSEAGEQFTPEFLAISPDRKIPALLDSDGPDGKPMALFEPGAMLLYLAGKTGLFLPRSVRARYEMLQWLMFQVGNVGPMLAQAHHFRDDAPDRIPYAIDRYTHEATRLYGVIDRQLTRTGSFIAGRQYSIADIAIFPWLRSHANLGVDLTEHPQVRRWYDTIAARPAVRRALDVLSGRGRSINDDHAREVLSGNTRSQRR